MREPLRFSFGHFWNWVLLGLAVAGISLWRFFSLDGRISLLVVIGWIVLGRVFTPWVLNEHIGFLDRWVFHDYNKAHTRYRRAIDTGHASASAYCALASLCLAEGDLPEAAMLLEEGVKRVPRDYHAHALLARVLSRLGRHEEALSSAIRVQEISNRTPWSYSVLGDVLKAKGEYTASMSSYQRACQAGIRAKEPYIGMAEILLGDGKVEEALTLLQEAQKKFRRDPDVCYWLGRALMAKKDVRAAKKCFSFAMEKRPPLDKSYHVPYKDLVEALAWCNLPNGS